jgi:acetaldehyde dehydrogenase (acetylating)
MTLGPGTWGGSIISENVTARHLMNIKRLAFETNPINPEEGVGSTMVATPSPTRSIAATAPSSWIEEIDRRIILKAGNTPVWKKSADDQRDDGATPQYKKPATFGTNISAEEIDRIVSTFSKERK